MRFGVLAVVVLSTSLAYATRSGVGGSVAMNAGFRATTIDLMGGAVDVAQLDAAFSAPAVATPLTQCYGNEKMLAWVELRNGSVKAVNVGGANVRALEACIANALKKTKLPTKERVVATLHIDPIPLPPPPVRRVISVGADAKDREGKPASDDAKVVVNTRRGVYRACYLKQLNFQPGIHGRVVVKVKINKDGGVSETTVVSSDLGNDAVGVCLAANLGRLKFPDGHEDVLTITFDLAES
ncbi:MAG TPA: AgmX/PglI C-terminal domain-containing protein [Kofleriaceae bacterium]|jgi:hypothetical protein